jgi:hypothetical protein
MESRWKDSIDYLKNMWGLLSVLSPLLGSGAVFVLPVIPLYRTSSAFWTIATSMISILYIYSSIWHKKLTPSLVWSFSYLVSPFLLGALYSFLFDFLPRTSILADFPTLTQHVMSVIYGLMFGSFSAGFGMLRVRQSTNYGRT